MFQTGAKEVGRVKFSQTVEGRTSCGQKNQSCGQKNQGTFEAVR